MSQGSGYARTSAADRARRLRSVKNALFGLAGTFSWTLFWDNNHTAETVDEHHEDHVYHHKWAFARKLDNDEVRPINLGSAHIKIFDETVKVLIDLFAPVYCFPDMNIRKAHARISFALGRAIQSAHDADFTAVLQFIVDLTSDGGTQGCCRRCSLESQVSKAYDPRRSLILFRKHIGQALRRLFSLASRLQKMPLPSIFRSGGVGPMAMKSCRLLRQSDPPFLALLCVLRGSRPFAVVASHPTGAKQVASPTRSKEHGGRTQRP